jgi:hypothetical protein
MLRPHAESLGELTMIFRTPAIQSPSLFGEHQRSGVFAERVPDLRKQEGRQRIVRSILKSILKPPFHDRPRPFPVATFDQFIRFSLLRKP